MKKLISLLSLLFLNVFLYAQVQPKLPFKMEDLN